MPTTRVEELVVDDKFLSRHNPYLNFISRYPFITLGVYIFPYFNSSNELKIIQIKDLSIVNVNVHILCKIILIIFIHKYKINVCQTEFDCKTKDVLEEILLSGIFNKNKLII